MKKVNTYENHINLYDYVGAARKQSQLKKRTMAVFHFKNLIFKNQIYRLEMVTR